MRGDVTGRCLEMARYMAETGDTVRGTARRFGVSKSLAHREMTVRLRALDEALYRKVLDLLRWHKAVRHLRGGEATRRRFLREKEEKWRIKTDERQN
ncbi:MAG: sporulation transcriptional regulator SpoIIID [Clostridia bacterium]|nr:sporulation transcriptional regulator SpoIIID [Clostridia bacterium]